MPMLTYSEELITPDKALDYLARNTHNRPLKLKRIKAYADAMQSGMWKLNGETLKFGLPSAPGKDDGPLLDGQNRLHALTQAGVSVVMSVIRGVESLAQETMDGNATRKLSDALKLRGERGWDNLAATIRGLFLWDHWDAISPDRRLVGGTGQPTVTNATLLSYLDRNYQTCKDIAEQCDHIRRSTRLPTSVTAPIVREMHHLDPDDAKDFLYRLQNRIPSPKNYGENDPLTRFAMAKERLFAHRGGYNTTELAALLVKTWNAYRDGVPLLPSSLKWRTGGSSPESFPRLK